jgi:hypothetical protein
MKKIIFQDIDGPLIPFRMYYTGDRPFDPQQQSFIWDPVAVDMLNRLCEKFDAQIVFNTAHGENPREVLLHQAAYNRLKYIHPEVKTKYPFTANRYQAITEFLEIYPSIQKFDWIVIDDMQVCLSRQIKVDWEVGMTLENYKKSCLLLGDEKFSPLLFIGHR